MNIRAIITGTTGMVGEGVLHECLNHPAVESVLVINRRSIKLNHQKLKEIIHIDFYDLKNIEEQLTNYNACYFCLGTTAVGKSEETYNKITFELTKNFADTLVKLNPEMTFCYVSGTGTDSSESGRLMWARVKGKTENYILNLGFKQAYAFRPGVILPTKRFKNTLTSYKILTPILPLVKLLFPKYVSTLKDIGLAMINSVTNEYEKKVLEIKDIVELSKR